MSTNTAWQTPSWLRITHGRTRLSQLWQVPVFLLGLGAVVMVCCGAMVRHGQQHQDYQDRLGHLRQVLQQKDSDVAALLPLAENLADQSSYFPGLAGEAHFLLGSILLRLADEAGPGQETVLQRALDHLQQAEAIGVAARDRPQLWYRLGKTLHRTGADLKQAIKYVAQGLPKGADNPAEGYGLLASAHLQLPSPDLDAALQANEQQIKLSNDEAILWPARLLRAELFVKKKLYGEALRVLERVGPNSPPALWQKSQYLQAICCEGEGLWSKGAPLWEELLQTPQVVPGGRRTILYAIGKCHHNSNPPAEQKAVQAWQQVLKEGGDEGQAAAIHLAEVYLLGPTLNFGLAADLLQEALAGIKDHKDYKNTFVPLEALRELVETAISVALEQEAHEPAQKFTQLCQKLSAPGVADVKLAEISAAWAKTLEEKARHAIDAQAEVLQQKAREQWGRAGEAFYQAAVASKDTEGKNVLLWQSIVCHRSANDDGKAIVILKEYMQSNLPAADLARAWFTLGEAYRALDRKSEAENAYYKCWEFADTPYAYHARYQLALDKIALKELDQAESILMVNVKEHGKNVDRDTSEKSLFLLASLKYQRGDFSHAAFWLQEAARRYPDNAEVYSVRDLLGDTFHQLAEELHKKIDPKNGLPATAVAQLKSNRQGLLTKAADTYEQLADDLKSLKERQPLTPLQEKLYRKASFNKADLEFKLENFPEALRRYQELAEMGRGQIEELIACQRIWMCCIALKFQPKDLAEALQIMEGTIKSAKSTLPQLPDEAFQGNAKSWSRKDWQDFVIQVEAGLKQISAQPPTAAPGS